MKKIIWIIGASSGLGRKIAEKQAAKGSIVIVSSRIESDLDDLCSHLRTVYNTEVHSFPLDLEQITDVESARKQVKDFIKNYSVPDQFYMMAGSNNESDEGLNSASVLNKMIQNNFTGPVHLINEVIIAAGENELHVVVASSVAAARARGKNIAYGSAKKALEQYCYGLMHALSNKKIKIQWVRFGFLDTNLSYGQKLLFKPASPEIIAGKVIKLSTKSSGLFYMPGFWFWIVFILNAIPFIVYKKIKF